MSLLTHGQSNSLEDIVVDSVIVIGLLSVEALFVRKSNNITFAESATVIISNRC